MILTEHLKAIAGRWFDSRFPPIAEQAVTLPLPIPVHAYDDEQPHSTLRPAVTLCRGEHVWVTSRWREIDRIVIQRPKNAPPLVLLYLAVGGIVSSRFDYIYHSRDLDEIAMAAKEASDGLG